ncbi:MAG: orotidine-5'-phosphate decarboxylase [Phycisphaerales bacterium]|jgi:orotidine-5'-phosphate decarboxylase|nr:orotidine-5'-phosphate decarboxylase [Phycisphaerales bacterium]
MASTNFADRLARAIDQTGTFACVGLDPVLDKLPAAVRQRATPAEAIGIFSRGVIDAVAGLIPIVKLQSACYERYGSAGVLELERTARHAIDRGVLVLLDAKRGDIGVTAEHYAAAAFDQLGADALTVSPYLGPDTLEPFVRSDKGLFVLVRTSNPGSDQTQRVDLASANVDATVAGMMARHVVTLGQRAMGACGLSAIGAVVGATKAADAADLRARMPNTVFLVPGYGAQGGTVDDVRVMLRPAFAGDTRAPLSQAGILVTASRSVIYPNAHPPSAASAPIGAQTASRPDPSGVRISPESGETRTDWQEAIGGATSRLREELTQIRKTGG